MQTALVLMLFQHSAQALFEFKFRNRVLHNGLAEDRLPPHTERELGSAPRSTNPRRDGTQTTSSNLKQSSPEGKSENLMRSIKK